MTRLIVVCLKGTESAEGTRESKSPDTTILKEIVQPDPVPPDNTEVASDATAEQPSGEVTATTPQTVAGWNPLTVTHIVHPRLSRLKVSRFKLKNPTQVTLQRTKMGGTGSRLATR